MKKYTIQLLDSANWDIELTVARIVVDQSSDLANAPGVLRAAWAEAPLASTLNAAYRVFLVKYNPVFGDANECQVALKEWLNFRALAVTPEPPPSIKVGGSISGSNLNIGGEQHFHKDVTINDKSLEPDDPHVEPPHVGSLVYASRDQRDEVGSAWTVYEMIDNDTHWTNPPTYPTRFWNVVLDEPYPFAVTTDRRVRITWEFDCWVVMSRYSE